MALKFSKCQYPGICNSCARTCEYIVTAGVHTIKLCRDCAITLSVELHKQIEVDRNKVEKEYNHSEETGLVAMRIRACSPQMIAEAGCNGDPTCRKCFEKEVSHDDIRTEG